LAFVPMPPLAGEGSWPANSLYRSQDSADQRHRLIEARGPYLGHPAHGALHRTGTRQVQGFL